MGTARESRVEVKSMLTAVSSKPSSSGRVYPFTALDYAMSPHTVHLILYYAQSPFGYFEQDSVRVPLSEVLSLYPPVVGRVNKNPEGNLEVKCNDAGLRVLQAKVCAGIDEWLRSADGNEELDLTAWEAMPEDPSTTWSPFRLQINEFECGGVAIGLSCPHGQADPTTLTILLKSWTETQRRQNIVHPPSFSPLPYNLTDTNAVRFNFETYAKPIMEPNFRKMTTVTFKFSDSAFKRCLEIYGISPKASPFHVFAALFWTRVASARRNSHDRVCICVDLRRLLPNPLPYGFCGNALNFSSLEIHDVVEKGIGHVACLINEHVASLDVEKIRVDLSRAGSHQGKLMYGADLTIVNMEHMIVEGKPLMYEAVFEDGVRPVHVSYRIGNVGGEGMITVMPSPEKGFGRTVAVSLPEDEMSKLLNDQEILRLEPKIILSGAKSDYYSAFKMIDKNTDH